MEKPIGLAIVTYTVNYGTYLQAFATQMAIRKLGYETEIINIESVINDVSHARRKYFLKQLLNYSEVKSYKATIGAIINKRFNMKYRNYILAREKMFRKFHDKYFKIGVKCESWNGLRNHCYDFSAVVVGSDQLWRPANIAGNFYTLNFVPDEINKISYATSFGLSEIRKNQEIVVRDFLNRIEFLSTREESGANIINKLTGRTGVVVCDPTLLINKEEWTSYLSTKPIIEDDYVFVYLLSKNNDHRAFVKRLAKEAGCKIVAVLHGAGYIKGDENFVDEYPINVGPFEFLNLIKNSKYVCTDSFHGCVFSIIFEKQFWAFKRFSDKDKMSTNSRVVNLLDRFDLNDRLVCDYSKINYNSINYNNTNQKVEEFRVFSFQFLENALTSKKE